MTKITFRELSPAEYYARKALDPNTPFFECEEREDEQQIEDERAHQAELQRWWEATRI